MSLTQIITDRIPDHAALRVICVEGGLTESEQRPVLAVLGELLAQWRERGVIRSGAVEPHRTGCFVFVAWELAGGDLSGCTKDALTHAVLGFEQSLRKPMINAPKLAVEIDGAVRFLSRNEFRELRRSGAIPADATAFDHLISTVGDLRAGRFEVPVTESWYGTIPL